MRVVFDARHLQTVSRTRGIGRYSRNLLAGLARQAPADIDWTLLTLRTFAAADPSLLPPHRVRTTARLRRPELSMLAFDPLLLSFELAGQGDLYHSVQLGLPAVRRMPVVLTIHDLAPLHWPEHYLRLPYSRVGHAWQYALAQRADAIIAVSDATRRDVIERLRIPAERIHVVAEAVDPAFAADVNVADRDAARSRFAVPGRYVIYVGQFDPRKNMDALFAAFARAAAGDDALRLVIVGTLGKLALLMRAALGRSGVDPGKVVITGSVDDRTLAALYAGAECLLHPAYFEGFGLTALEALACGTPVVAYRAGAVAEVVGDAGLLVEPGPETLGDALVRFLGDPALAVSLRARARQRSQAFSWDRAAAETIAVYRSLA
ncbi:MAG: glycosyltransferase family 1 protein [Candidatus Limnocylindrales bacterium]